MVMIIIIMVVITIITFIYAARGDIDDDMNCKKGTDNDGIISDDDIYIMMHVCLFVTKNDHFLLGVSCNHLNPP